MPKLWKAALNTYEGQWGGSKCRIEKLIDLNAVSTTFNARNVALNAKKVALNAQLRKDDDFECQTKN